MQVSGAVCQQPPAGLVSWWHSEGSAADIAGTNAGSLQGGAVANAVGIVGSCFSFNGTTAFVQIPDSPSLRPTNLTIECWLRFNSLDTTGTAGVGQQYIVFKQNTRAANFEGYSLTKERNGGVEQLVFGVTSAAGLVLEARSVSLITTGAWYHVAGVRGPNFIQIYVNGQLEGQTAVNFVQDYGTLPLYFGSSGQSYWDRKFSGSLDEVTLYNRPLSSNEISAIYVAGTAGKCKAVLIESQPQSIARLAGQSASFSVSASGLAPIFYQWRLDGNVLAGQTNPVLTLPSVSPADQGSYTVVVSNVLGAVISQAAVLTVGAAPVITQQPASRTNIAGSTASFTLLATGSPAPAYQWRFNGAPLPGATNSAFNIGNVQIGDAGDYSATASNAIGVVTSSVAALTVWVTPSITVQPVSRTNLAGTAASFSVSASGVPALTYQWRFNGAPIAGATGSVYSLASVQASHAGSYSVAVSNAAGGLSSSAAQLTVWVPPVISSQPPSRTNIAGTAATFSVAASGTPAPTYQWRFDGSPITGATGSIYSISDVQISDEGIYSVVASNAAGSVESAGASLTVWVSPVISSQPVSRTNIAGTAATFSVAASGTPTPTYQWRFDGSPITGATGSIYSISDVQISDEGIYSVVASNAAGAVESAAASLIVWVPPVIIQNPLPAEVFEGQSVNFTVAATGTAPISYQWRLNGVPVAGATNTGYMINDAMVSHGGAYSAVAINPAGSVTSSIALLIVHPAAPLIGTQPVGGTIVQGETWTFSVGVSGTPPLTYQWMFNGATILGASGSSYTITNAQPSQAGNYAAFVANAAGFTNSLEAALTVIPAVVVPDLCLSNAIRCALGKQNGALTVPDLMSLTCLSAANCDVSSLSGLEMAVNLESLQLGNNKLTDLAPLQGLVHLKTLSLENNNIASISPIAGLSNLTALSLSQNPITNIEYVVLLSKLETAALCSLGITNAGFLRPLTGLRDLQLRENILTEVSFVTNLPALRNLDLRWNAITNLTPIGSGPPTLTSLYLGGNRIAELPLFANLTNLALLSLDHNEIQDLAALASLTNLSYLSVGNNPVTNYLALSSLLNLTGVDVSSSQLTNLSFMTGASSLQYVDCSWNEISDLTPLLNFTNLQSVVLAGNGSVDLAQLPQVPILRNLWLPECGILNLGFVETMSSLRYLNVEKNQISDASVLSTIPNLTGLDLGYNPINDFSALASLNNLESLRLEGLCLQTADVELLANMLSLKFLDLNYNRITSISIVSNMASLSTLYALKNSLSDLQPLAGLTGLRFVDVRRNSLNLGTSEVGSPSAVLAALRCAMPSQTANCGQLDPAFSFEAKPQNEAPVFVDDENTRWFIPCTQASSIAFRVWDDSFGDEKLLCPKIIVTASSDNESLVRVIGARFTESDQTVTLTVSNQNCALIDNMAHVQVSLQDDSGAVTSMLIEVVVVNNTPVVISCPDTDISLLDAISRQAGVPVEQLTPADLLMRDLLTTSDTTAGDPCVWQWLTNLSALHFYGGTLSNLDFVASLPNLKFLSLTDMVLPDTSALASLANLEHVDLSGTGLTNSDPLLSLPQGLKRLDLARNYLRDLSFLGRFTMLSELNLDDNRIVDVSTLSALTGLNRVWIQQNWLTNINPFVNLPILRYLDIRTNFVNLSPQSSGVQDLFALTNPARPGGAVAVEFITQRQPRFDVRTNWVIRPGVQASVNFELFDVHSDEAIITAATTNAGVLSFASTMPRTHTGGTLLVTPVVGVSNGTAVITLTATNDVPFALSTNIVVIVTPWFDVGSVLNGPGLGWVTGGEKPWFGQSRISHDGVAAAQSGAVNDLQISTMETILVGPGTLRFWWRVSSETNFDFLTLTNNNVSTGLGISGEVGWQLMTTAAWPGTNRFVWTYRKDKDTSTGLDAAFVDEVSFVPEPFVVANGFTPDGRFQVGLQGQSGKTYHLETSTNLESWSVLSTITLTGQFGGFLDTNQVQGSRFYRLRDAAAGP